LLLLISAEPSKPIFHFFAVLIAATRQHVDTIFLPHGS